MGRAVDIVYTDKTEKAKTLKRKESLGGTASSTFKISGLDCPSCAAKLEEALLHTPGVEDARVSFAAAKLEVVYDSRRLALEEVADRVAALGYGAVLDEPAFLPREGNRGAAEGRLARWRSLAAENKYLLPTLLSGVLTGIAFLLRGSSWGHFLFVAAVICGGYLPARSGLLLLLRGRQADMNVLMTVAVLGALALRQYEEAAAVVFLFSLGNALQAYALGRTRKSIGELMELAPAQALVKREGEEIWLPIEGVEVGDLVIVRPGEKIPVDGVVVYGESLVNQAPITGESLPAKRQPGDEVFAGTINLQGVLEVEVMRRAEDNTLARIVALVEEAQAQRAPSQQFVDRFARYYTPLVILGAALVAAVPPLAFGQPFNKWLYEALAMLLVACPCALVISTPVSVVSAIGSAARQGVLIKGGAYLEEMGSLAAVAFDKTGTLTQGKLEVTEVIPFNGCRPEEVLEMAAAAESRSTHPLGAAVAEAARERGIKAEAAEEFAEVFGRGVQGRVKGKTVYAGSVRFFKEKGVALNGAEEVAAALQEEGKTAVIVGDGRVVYGVIAAADVLRAEAREAVEKLRQEGIEKIVMLTGDNSRTASRIAAELGIDEVKAELLPEDKVGAIRELLESCRKAAMVGDGVNDAPALATATVGIVMGAAGSNAALEAADIALMGDDLLRLSYLVRLGRRTLQIIKQNIFLSLLIKGAILLLVIPGRLTLWLAVAADMGSSLLVTLNGMRLMRVR